MQKTPNSLRVGQIHKLRIKEKVELQDTSYHVTSGRVGKQRDAACITLGPRPTSDDARTLRKGEVNRFC
jgi:hypothetical protein